MNEEEKEASILGTFEEFRCIDCFSFHTPRRSVPLDEWRKAGSPRCSVCRSESGWWAVDWRPFPVRVLAGLLQLCREPGRLIGLPLWRRYHAALKADSAPPAPPASPASPAPPSVAVAVAIDPSALDAVVAKYHQLHREIGQVSNGRVRSDLEHTQSKLGVFLGSALPPGVWRAALQRAAERNA